MKIIALYRLCLALCLAALVVLSAAYVRVRRELLDHRTEARILRLEADAARERADASLNELRLFQNGAPRWRCGLEGSPRDAPNVSLAERHRGVTAYSKTVD